MGIIKKTYAEMVADGIRYLSRNSDVSYFSEGSIARALVEATALEINRLQNFVSAISENSFLGTASGLYLDLFGQMLAIPRLVSRTAFATAEDGAVRFYVNSGTLGSRLPHPTDTRKGLIPAGTTITNSTGTTQYVVANATEFQINSKSVYVSVISNDTGAEYNIGAGQLTIHNLSNTEVLVTNDTAIVSGGDVESDSDYRYRLSKALTTRFGSNRTAVQVAATSQPGIVDARVIEFARGAGTFDVLLIPKGNRVTEDIKNNSLRAINQVIAFGVYPTVREPEYVRFKIIVQLRYKTETTSGRKDSIRNSIQSAILAYFATIPLGGEFVVNQLRSVVLSNSDDVVDINITEVCIDGKPRVLRNIKLREDEIFIPDDKVPDPVIVL